MPTCCPRTQADQHSPHDAALALHCHGHRRLEAAQHWLQGVAQRDAVWAVGWWGVRGPTTCLGRRPLGGEEVAQQTQAGVH